MIDERELQKWIARLECEDSSWGNYEKLAVLYTVMNQQQGAPAEVSEGVLPRTVADHENVGRYGDSDFLRAVEGKDLTEAWSVIDELMDTLRVVNQRVYNSVMKKLQAL